MLQLFRCSARGQKLAAGAFWWGVAKRVNPQPGNASTGLPRTLATPSMGGRAPGSGPAFGEPGYFCLAKMLYTLAAAMPAPEDLQQLGHELTAMRLELQTASTRTEVDRVIERREALFRRLRPPARQVLISVIHRRLLEVPD
jgi:hypothetical protein